MKLTRKKLESLIREELQKEMDEAITSKGIDPFAPEDQLDAGPDGGMDLGLSYDKQKMMEKIHNILKNTELGKMAMGARKSSLVGDAAMQLMQAMAPDDLSSGME